MFRIVGVAWLLAAVICALLFSRTAPESPADFTYVNSSDVHTLDPARMSWAPDFRVALNIWEGLTTWDAQTTEPIEGSALLPPLIDDDGLRYTFTLRPDARWSNGDAVTAHDFVRGWRRAMEPGTGSDYVFLFTDHIAGAADYVYWRRQAVAALTALTRLRDGWGIEPNQARDLARANVLERAEIDTSPPPPDASDIDWSLFGRALRDSSVDWARLHQDFLESHARQLDQHFSEVGIEPAGDHTLTVHLTAPCSYFLDLAAFPTLLPCHESVERLRESHKNLPLTQQGLVVYDPQWTKPHYRHNGYPGLITNGAYVPANWTFKRRLRLKANPFYRDAASIACRTIDMVVYDNLSTALIAYEAGDVDLLPAMPTAYGHEIARLARTGERKDFHLCPVLATYFFNFNCAPKLPDGRDNPLHDARLRRALALAVDKVSVVENVIKRADRVAHSFVPPDAIPAYNPPAGLPHDPDAARQWLAEAGFPDGKGLPPLQILHVANDDRIVGAVARMWEQTLGVQVELITKESKTFGEDKAAHRFMIARGNWYADYIDPTTFLNCLATGNGNNDSGYSNNEYDALLSQARNTRDPAQRAKLLQQAEAIIVERDLPLLPLLHFAEPIAIQPRVNGLYPNIRLWFPFRGVTVRP